MSEDQNKDGGFKFVNQVSLSSLIMLAGMLVSVTWLISEERTARSVLAAEFRGFRVAVTTEIRELKGAVHDLERYRWERKAETD